MPLVAFSNLGCSKNQVDGSRMLRHVLSVGYTLTEDASRADVIIVNTCAFIEAAKVEAITMILEMVAFKKNGRCKKLVVCGCFSQRFRESAAGKFPEVDLWAGMDDWPELFARHLKTGPRPSFVRELPAPRATQYLKIAEGCSHGCTFCAIPLIRGKFRSCAPAAILEEAKWLVGEGVLECVVVAQDSSMYGKDRGTSLVLLLQELLANTPFPWIRVMYLHPSLVDDELLRLFAREPRLCPYFDIPLQHAADTVLKAMGRHPLSKGIVALVERIRAAVPDAAIRTAFIVGFPGETEEIFEELLRFVETMKFDKAGVFPFSPEEGTTAFSMRPRPRNATVARRCEALMSLQREISASINQSRVGRIVDVIVDGKADQPGFTTMGRTRWDAPEVDGNVYMKTLKIPCGAIVPVRIHAAGDYDLYGEPETR
jgi:ribosomal protein S12 methylthiotransferase